MIPLTLVFSITRKIGSIIEIMKKVNGKIEYTLVPVNSINDNGTITMIDKKIVERKKDFFRKIDSLKK